MMNVMVQQISVVFVMEAMQMNWVVAVLNQPQPLTTQIQMVMVWDQVQERIIVKRMFLKVTYPIIWIRNLIVPPMIRTVVMFVLEVMQMT